MITNKKQNQSNIDSWGSSSSHVTVNFWQKRLSKIKKKQFYKKNFYKGWRELAWDRRCVLTCICVAGDSPAAIPGKWNLTVSTKENVFCSQLSDSGILQHVLTPSRQTEIRCWKLEGPHYSRSHLRRALWNSWEKVWSPWGWREERKEA